MAELTLSGSATSTPPQRPQPPVSPHLRRSGPHRTGLAFKEPSSHHVILPLWMIKSSLSKRSELSVATSMPSQSSGLGRGSAEMKKRSASGSTQHKERIAELERQISLGEAAIHGMRVRLRT
jgi:hypothetical protein